MDRRKFIKTGAAAVAAVGIGQERLFSAESPKLDSFNVNLPSGDPERLALRFLGTGAADWNGRDDRGELRRLTSILLEKTVLVDLTPSNLDMIPPDATPEYIFYTHSHGDHYSPKTAVELGVTHVFAGNTWISRARKDFAEASEACGRPAPIVTGMNVGDSINIGDIRFTALPANHSTGDTNEQTLMFLIEKGPVRLLYATDTGGIPSAAARIAGIDAHVNPGKPITALIMEATMGLDYDEDFRIFTHSSVGTVLRTANVLTSTGRLKPLHDDPVYLTHMARTLHGTQKELEATLPAPLKAAWDGLEIIL